MLRRLINLWIARNSNIWFLPDCITTFITEIRASDLFHFVIWRLIHLLCDYLEMIKERPHVQLRIGGT